MSKRPVVARSLDRGITALAGLALAFATLLAGPAGAQTPSSGPDDGILPAGGVVPGSGAGLVLEVVGADDAGPWERLVAGSILDEAATAAAVVVRCEGTAVPATGGCTGGGTDRRPDVVVDLRPSVEPGAGCPPPPTALIVVDRPATSCRAVAIGVDVRAAGRLLGQTVGDAIRSGDRCAADRLLILAPPDVVGGTDAAVAGLRDGFLAACRTLADEAVVEIAASPEAIATDLRATLDGLAPEVRVVILGADDAVTLEALKVVKALDRPGAVTIGAIGGSQPAWAAIACDPLWVGDVALFPERYGRTVVPAAVGIAAGEALPSRLTTPFQILDATNIRSIYPDVPAC